MMSMLRLVVLAFVARAPKAARERAATLDGIREELAIDE